MPKPWLLLEELWEKGVDANLCIVGKQGSLMESFIGKLRTHAERGGWPTVLVADGISDEYLEKVYAVSACLIIASEDEGFGLPIIGAPTRSLPIIPRDIPVFREVIYDEHAFYFNGLEPVALASAIQAWIKLRDEGCAPSSEGIPRLTWRESANEIRASFPI